MLAVPQGGMPLAQQQLPSQAPGSVPQAPLPQYNPLRSMAKFSLQRPLICSPIGLIPPLTSETPMSDISASLVFPTSAFVSQFVSNPPMTVVQTEPSPLIASGSSQIGASYSQVTGLPTPDLVTLRRSVEANFASIEAIPSRMPPLTSRLLRLQRAQFQLLLQL